MTTDEKLDLLISKVTSLDGKVTSLEGEVSILGKNIIDINSKVTNIQLDIENEIKPNIMRVAEGHLDLSRKLNEAINFCNNIDVKFESYDLLIKYHDNEIAKLKLAK